MPTTLAPRFAPADVRPVARGNEPRPAGRPTAAQPRAAVPALADSLTLSTTLTNDRFAGSEALARVSRAGGPVALTDRDAVVRVQQALLDMAFFMPGGADGAWGPGAAQALKNFQAAAGLPRTGQLDAATLRQLDKFAPPAGKMAWDRGVDRGLVPDPVVRDPQGRPYMQNGKPMVARVVVGIGQHRAFHFDRNGELVKIYAVRTGTSNHADGRGAETRPAVKRIDAKMSGAALRELGASKWDAPGAFGEALLALSKIDPATGKPVPFSYNGQELHGVPNNGRGEPTGVGRDFSHGCVGMANADIKAIFADVRANEIVNFIP